MLENPTTNWELGVAAVFLSLSLSAVCDRSDSLRWNKCTSNDQPSLRFQSADRVAAAADDDGRLLCYVCAHMLYRDCSSELHMGAMFLLLTIWTMNTLRQCRLCTKHRNYVYGIVNEMALCEYLYICSVAVVT